MTQEIELKYQFMNNADFQRVLDIFMKITVGPIEKLKQKNILFDTPALDLRKNNFILRLRRQNKFYYLCSKQKINNYEHNNLFVRQELEVKISKYQAKLILKHELSRQEILGDLIKLDQRIVPELRPIGYFCTLRTKIPVIINNLKLYIELDKTTYEDKSEYYELEIEFNSASDANLINPAVKNLLDQAGIKTSAVMAKSTRLYKKLFD